MQSTIVRDLVVEMVRCTNTATGTEWIWIGGCRYRAWEHWMRPTTRPSSHPGLPKNEIAATYRTIPKQQNMQTRYSSLEQHRLPNCRNTGLEPHAVHDAQQGYPHWFWHHLVVNRHECYAWWDCLALTTSSSHATVLLRKSGTLYISLCNRGGTSRVSITISFSTDRLPSSCTLERYSPDPMAYL